MQKTSINKNTIYSTIKSVAAIVFPLITFPYASRVLGPENIGKVNFANSIVSYFTLIASLGVNTYAIRECSKLREEPEKLRLCANQIFSLNCLTTVIAYVSLFVTLLVCRPLDNYRTLILIQSLTIMCSTLGTEWINTCFEDFKYITIRTVAMQVFSLLMLLLIVKNPSDYLKYAIISVIAAGGANIINIFYRERFCKIRFTIHMDIKKHLPPIMMLFSLILAQTVYCNSDITILGFLRGDVEVGLYSTSVKIYNLVNTMVASITWVVMPKLSLGFAQKDYESVNKNLRYALSYIMTLGIPALVGMNAITPEIIEVIAGKEFLDAVWSLRILSVALLASFIGGFIGNLMMLTSGREAICLKSAMISMILNVVLNLVLIPLWGLNAAAMTTAIAEIVGIFIKLPYIEKEIQIDRLGDILKGPILGGVGIVIISIVMKAVSTDTMIVSLGTIGFSVIWYLFVLILVKNEFIMGYIKRDN